MSEKSDSVSNVDEKKNGLLEHIRRCHRCCTINIVNTGRVEMCSKCGCFFAPFYFFDDFCVEPFSEDKINIPLKEGVYSPVFGLTAFWQIDN